MHAFNFELENVLRFKRQLERLAEMKELKAAAATAAARRQVEALQERLARLAIDMQKPAVDSWPARFEFAGHVSRAVQDATKVVERAVQAEAQARRERVALSAEVEALLTLRRQRWDEYRRDAARAEQVRLDDRSLHGWAARGPRNAQEPDS